MLLMVGGDHHRVYKLGLRGLIKLNGRMVSCRTRKDTLPFPISGCGESLASIKYLYRAAKEHNCLPDTQGKLSIYLPTDPRHNDHEYIQPPPSRNMAEWPFKSSSALRTVAHYKTTAGRQFANSKRWDCATLAQKCPRLRVHRARHRGPGRLTHAVETRLPGGDAHRTHVAHWARFGR